MIYQIQSGVVFVTALLFGFKGDVALVHQFCR